MGPLFTLGSYAAAPLGAAGGLWALKVVMALASLAAIALIARAAQLMGHSARWAAVFVGLNPVLLVLADRRRPQRHARDARAGGGAAAHGRGEPAAASRRGGPGGGRRA